MKFQGWLLEPYIRDKHVQTSGSLCAVMTGGTFLCWVFCFRGSSKKVLKFIVKKARGHFSPFSLNLNHLREVLCKMEYFTQVVFGKLLSKISCWITRPEKTGMKVEVINILWVLKVGVIDETKPMTVLNSYWILNLDQQRNPSSNYTLEIPHTSWTRAQVSSLCEMNDYCVEFI